MPKISIIIPIYNAVHYLQYCLDSIYAQTFTDFEVILIDDCSHDASWLIIEKNCQHDTRLRAHKLTTNSGSGAARNVGIAAASGDYLLFCDADDAYPKNALELLYAQTIGRHVDLVCGNISHMDVDLLHYTALDANLVTLMIKEEKMVHDLAHPALWWALFHPRFLIASQLLKTYSLRYPDLRRGQDPVFLAKVLCAARNLVLLPHTVYLYRTQTSIDKTASIAVWIEYLTHFRLVLESFLAAGQHHCACFQYVQSLSTWCDFRKWRRLSSKQKKQVWQMFCANATLMRDFSPWLQNYAPYTVDTVYLASVERYYCRFGGGAAILYRFSTKITYKFRLLFKKIIR